MTLREEGREQNDRGGIGGCWCRSHHCNNLIILEQACSQCGKKESLTFIPFTGVGGRLNINFDYKYEKIIDFSESPLVIRETWHLREANIGKWPGGLESGKNDSGTETKAVLLGGKGRRQRSLIPDPCPSVTVERMRRQHGAKRLYSITSNNG